LLSDGRASSSEFGLNPEYSPIPGWDGIGIDKSEEMGWWGCWITVKEQN